MFALTVLTTLLSRASFTVNTEISCLEESGTLLLFQGSLSATQTKENDILFLPALVNKK